jgi:hypothetical protein
MKIAGSAVTDWAGPTAYLSFAICYLSFGLKGRGARPLDVNL